MSVELRQKLQSMDDRDFELFVGQLWSRQGWATTVTSQSNDRGIDVLAEIDFPYPRKIVLQAKRYSESNTVGSRIVQQCASHTIEKDVDEVVLVTTSTFTRAAGDEAEKKNVKLVDVNTLCDIIQTSNAYDLVDQYSYESSAVGELESATGIRLDDGKITPNESVSGAENLIRLVTFLWEHGYLTEDDIPYGTGPKRFLLNTDPVHKDADNRMKDGKEITSGLWLEANLSNDQKWRVMEQLAEEFLIV